MSQPVARLAMREGLIVTVTLSPARSVSDPQPIRRMKSIETVSIRHERAPLPSPDVTWMQEWILPDEALDCADDDWLLVSVEALECCGGRTTRRMCAP